MIPYTLTNATRRALEEALSAQFDVFELRQLLRRCDTKLAEAVPEVGVSPAQLVDRAVGALDRFGLTPMFFDHWREVRSARVTEINALERRLQRREGVTNTADLAGGEVTVVGDPDAFRLICKVTGPNFVRSTKAMELPGGCLVQVSTKELHRGGTAVAEAVSFVPGTRLLANDDGKTWRLVAAAAR